MVIGREMEEQQGTKLKSVDKGDKRKITGET